MAADVDFIAVVAGGTASALLIVGAFAQRQRQLAEDLERHGLLRSRNVQRGLAVIVPVIEVALGGGGLAATYYLHGRIATVVLMLVALVFACYGAYGLFVLRHVTGSVPCGCGGEASMSHWIVIRAFAVSGCVVLRLVVPASKLYGADLAIALAATVTLTVVLWYLPGLVEDPNTAGTSAPARRRSHVGS